MIGQVLEIMMSEQLMTTQDIAREVGIQPETLSDVIELLVRRGLVEEVGPSCEMNEHCGSCPSASSCSMSQSSGKQWRVTKRGEMFVRKTRK